MAKDPDLEGALSDLRGMRAPSTTEPDLSGALKDLDSLKSTQPVQGQVPTRTGLSPRAARYAKTQRVTLKRLESRAKALEKATGRPVLPEEKKPKGFWWLLEQMDRPRNATHNVLLHWMRGDHKGFADAFESFQKGWTGQEHAHFEDLIEEMGPEAQMMLLGPLTAPRGAGGMGLTLEQARKLVGFGGDVLLDPLNVAMFAGAAARIAQGIGVGGRTLAGLQTASKMDPIAQATGLGWKLTQAGAKITGTEKFFTNLARATFWRTTGFPQLDRLRMAKIDARLATKAGLLDESKEIAKELTPLRKQHAGLVAKLAEEPKLGAILRLMDRHRVIGKSFGAPARVIQDQIEQALKLDVPEGPILNPKAVRELASIGDQETYELAKRGSTLLRDFDDKLKAMEQISGVQTRHLGGQLERKMAKAQMGMMRTFRRVVRETERDHIQSIRELQVAFDTRHETLAQLLGPKKLAELHQQMMKLGPEGSLAKVLRGGKIDDKKAMDMMRNFLGRLQPGMIAVLREAAKDKSAAETIYNDFGRAVLENLKDSPVLQRQISRMERIGELMERVPEHVRHVATEEAIERMSAIRGDDQRWYARLWTPQAAHHLTRKFQIEGRPLSFEEVEEIVARGDYSLTAPPTTVIGMPDLSSGPLYKKQNLIQKVKGKPKELAQFFDTDERTILATSAYETARAVTAADYLREGIEIIGGKTEQALTSAERAGWIKFKEVNGAESAIQMMPQLADIYVRPDLGHALIRGASSFMDDVRWHPVVRFYDQAMGLWKVGQLVLWPAFHTRNAFGNKILMHQAGWLTQPRDLMDHVLAGRLQAAAATNRPQVMKSLKFYVKSIDQEIDGHQMHQLMLRNGVIDTGWHGAELGKLLKHELEPMFGSWRALFPLSQDFVGYRAGSAVGRFLENMDRATLFANRLRRGDSVEVASATVKKFLGDYRTEVMTPFERNFAARVFPFFRWSRFNIPLQFEQLLMNTRNRAMVLAAYRGQPLASEAVAGAWGLQPVEQEEIEPRQVEQWVQEAAGVPVARDSESGELLFFLFEGWHPAADIDNWLSVRSIYRFVLNSAVPFTKPIEYATGRSLFLDRQLEGQRTEFLGKVMDAEFANQLRSLRVLSEIDRLDPLGAFHRERSLKPTGERALAFGLGLKAERTRPAATEIRVRDARIEALQRNINAARRALRAQEELEGRQ